MEVVTAKESIRSYEKVTRILSKQRPEGYWESPEQPYHPKYKSTYWQVMILSQLGLDRSDERVRKACEYIFKARNIYEKKGDIENVERCTLDIEEIENKMAK